MSDFKSEVFIEGAVYVHINGSREVEVESEGLPRLQMAADDLAYRFLHWLAGHPEIESYRGGSSGMGSFTGWFPASQREAIEGWFAEEGISPQGGDR